MHHRRGNGRVRTRLTARQRLGDAGVRERRNGEGDIQLDLEARRKFGFLDSTITAPEPPYTMADWTTINAMLMSWITNTIDLEVKFTLSKFHEPSRLWEYLKTRFALVKGPRIQQLWSAIAKCAQPKNIFISQYYGKMNSLWEELFNHKTLIDCQCCFKCMASSLHAKRRENRKLHDFLMGLNPDYSHLRSNILSTDPLPSLYQAYQLVVQDERVRMASVGVAEQPTDVLGFAIYAPRGRDKTDHPVCSHCRKTGHDVSRCWALVACTHCKKHGHDVSTCFELVGYPEGWQKGPKIDNSVGKAARPSSGQRGRPAAKANAAASSSTTVALDSSGSIFTADQWKALTGLIGNTPISDDRLSGKFCFTSWIIDTGANHHVTSDFSWLFDVTTLGQCPVGFPNGSSVLATHSGSVKLSDTITITNVLY